MLHRVVQDPRVTKLCHLHPGRHHPARRPGKGEWRVGLAVLWASLGGGIYHLYPRSIDQDAAIRPQLSSREAGCAVQLCAREEMKGSLEDS